MIFSIIIPIFEDEIQLRALLPTLQHYRNDGHEIIVVDASDSDAQSIDLASSVDLLDRCAQGRAKQMNWGAAQASGEVLLFLHADTRLPPDALSLIMEALSGTERCWGRFDVRLENSSWPYRVIESAMNWRSHLSGVVTGDQALFVTRAVFENLGGFAELPLMEDIELSKRLRRVTRPVRLRVPVRASSRRWEAHGLVRTILVMWWLRLLYFLGVDPDVLSRIYYKK